MSTEYNKPNKLSLDDADNVRMKAEKNKDRISLLVLEEEQRSKGEKRVSGNLKKRINFDLKPEELESYLDAYVIKQDEAKAILATKVCTHFNRVRYMEDQGLKDSSSTVGMIKNNVLLVGPTGVGKTYLVKLIAQRLGVPFVKGDATKFSETGYVGGDVEDLVRDLVQAADDDIELAQYGIIYIDEIDKIASSNSFTGPDVSRTGVQRALLKPMEETEIDMKVSHDPISQIQAIEHYRKTGKREQRTINTKNILFIMSGAFNKLEEIIGRRLNKKPIGFGSPECGVRGDECLISRMTPQDLIDYGFESEFIGRMPVQVVLDELSADDLYQILRNPNNPVILSKKRDFAAYGVDLRFEEKALEKLAELAAVQKTGARGLIGVMEKALISFEKKLPSTQIKQLLVTPELVEHPEESLKNLLADPENYALKERFESAGFEEIKLFSLSLTKRKAEIKKTYGLKISEELIELVAETYNQTGFDIERALSNIKDQQFQIKAFEFDVLNESNIIITFDDEAVYTIMRISKKAGMTPLEYLQGRRDELVSALELVRSRTGRQEYILPRESIVQTMEYVTRMVGESAKAGA
jgi:ATP-dependent Clp protease ATP-binding subunit ClpX